MAAHLSLVIFDLEGVLTFVILDQGRPSPHALRVRYPYPGTLKYKDNKG